MGDGLYAAILRAATTEETISAICVAAVSEVNTLPIDTIEAVLGALSETTASPKHVIAQSKLLSGVFDALKNSKAKIAQLLEFYDRVTKFGGAQPDARVVETRTKALEDISGLVATLIRDPNAGVSLKALGPLCHSAPLPAVASIVAALGEKAVNLEAVGEYAGVVARAAPEGLAALPAETILRLIVGSSKSEQVSSNLLGPTCAAASAALPAWPADDVIKLLFAMVKVKDAASNADMAGVFVKATATLAPQIGSLSVPNLIKVALSVSKVEACRSFLASCAESAAGKTADIPAPQLLLLTQGFGPLGEADPSLAKLLGFWAENLAAPAFEALSADQLAKLAQVLAVSAPGHAAFWEALGKRLAAQAKTLTAAGQASVAAAFPEGAGPQFPDKEALLTAVTKMKEEAAAKEKEKEQEKNRGRDEDRKGGDRGGDRDRRDDRDRDRRSRDRGRDDRDRGRDDRDRGRDDRRDDRRDRRDRSRSRRRR